jgi:hypothetical protein
MMVAVAVVAVAVGGGLSVARLKRLRDEYRQKAAYHAQEMEQWDLSGGGSGAKFFDGHNVYRLDSDGRILRWYPLPDPPVGMMMIPEDGPWVEGMNGLPEEVREEVTRRILAFRARADYHAALHRKYKRAAASPWLAIDRDPPEPQ